MALPPWLQPHGAGIYHVENSVGILVVMPLAIFAVVPVVQMLAHAPDLWRRSGPRTAEGDLRLWLVLSLSGMLALSLGILLLYFYVAVRYLSEVIPALALLSLLGIWEAYRRMERRPALRTALLAAVVLLVLATVIMGVLLPFGEDHGTLLRFNPQLMRQLRALFGR
jgi:hypothetical protein